jgi:hypothetical protein
MKKTSLIMLLISVAVLVNVKNSNAQDSAGNIPLEVNTVDERFSLDNVSFFKRLDNKSSNLNISFDLRNKTENDIKLKVFLVAFRRIDSVDNNMRKYIKYPKWIKIDIDKEIQKNILLDSVPELDKNAVDSNIKEVRVFPEYQKYIQYINKNTEQGKDVIIPGFNSSSRVDDGTKEFYVVTSPLKTTVYGRLDVAYNETNDFFNHLGIIVVDPSEKKIVASRLFYFAKPMKAF